MRLSEAGARAWLPLFAFYAFWISTFRLVALTLITYFLSRSNPRTSLGEIQETFSHSEILIAGLAAGTFIFLLRGLRPNWKEYEPELFWQKSAWKSSFSPGVLSGIATASAVVVALLLSGHYVYVGSFLQTGEGFLTLLGFLIRTITLLFWIQCEEFLFRERLFIKLREKAHPALLIPLMIAVSVLLKTLQFDPGITQATMLAMLFLFLTLHRFVDGTFLWGTGYAFGLFFIFQPVFGLPLFGNEFTGLFMLRYQMSSEQPGGQSLVNILTGGSSGPLSSGILFSILAIQCARYGWRNKKTVFNAVQGSVT